MTNYVGAEKPSLDDLLQYGVLGMKWGKSRAKANGTQIRAARRNVRRQGEALLDQKDVVKAKPKGSADRAKAEKKFKSMKADLLNNPDRAIAARLTRGEKAVAIILLTPAGAAAAIGATSGVSRAIERKQELRKLK